MTDAYERVPLGLDTSGRPLVVNRRTKAMLDEVERITGIKRTIIQGSYRGSQGAEQSADTHDRGGVVDLRTWDLSAAELDRWDSVARGQVGFIVWRRTVAQGFDPHEHIIAKGDEELSDGARDQQNQAAEGWNGLARSVRVKDNLNLHVPTFDYDAYLEMQIMLNLLPRIQRLEARLQDNTDARAQFAYKAITGNGSIAVALRTLLARVGPNTDARAQYAYKTVLELAPRIDALETAVDKLVAAQAKK